MLFELTLGLGPELLAQSGKPPRIHAREAVRAIVWRDGALLLVRTVHGDYKFPGGGVSENEDRLEALKREVREETGFSIESVGECIGVTAERMPDRFEPDAFFAMTSRYYPATVSGAQADLALDEYEAAQGFMPVWTDPVQAVAANEAILSEGIRANRWVARETAVLRALLDSGPADTRP